MCVQHVGWSWEGFAALHVMQHLRACPVPCGFRGKLETSKSSEQRQEGCLENWQGLP